MNESQVRAWKRDQKVRSREGMRELWYRKPAKVWEEALPLGNGRIGAMVFGNIENERIQVNEESVWYGGKKDRINPDAREYLPKVRELIREGRIGAAQDLMGTVLTGTPNSENPYQTLGDLRIYFKHQGIKGDDAESPDVAKAVVDPEKAGYRRSLSLSDGACRVEYCLDGVKYRREHFISKPADCMVMKFSAEGDGRINFTLKLDRWYFFKGVKKTYAGGAGEANGIVMYGRPGEDGHAFVMMMKGQVKGGSLKVLGESLIVEGAEEAVLYFGAVTQYRHPEADYAALEEILCDQLERVMTRDYEELFEEHVADHKALFDRVQLKLRTEGAAANACGSEAAGAAANACGSEAAGKGMMKGEGLTGDLPTDERLAKVAAGETDLGLEELLFDYGRYLMIAGSREGTLPTTLQGLWNQEFMPPWGAKYTININTEMNYWPAETCNLSECHKPLFEHLKKMREDGRKVAREMYGCRGFVAHHNTDVHGDCAPQDLWIPATYWPMGAAWLCTHLWTHYEYTQDKEFLREAFPIMAEAALYFVDALEPWGEYYVTNPSSSPENTYILPSGEKGCVCMGPTMDNQILRDLFTICLRTREILGGAKAGQGAEESGNESAGQRAEAIGRVAGQGAGEGGNESAGQRAEAIGQAAGQGAEEGGNESAGQRAKVIGQAAGQGAGEGGSATREGFADSAAGASWQELLAQIPDLQDPEGLMEAIRDRLSKLPPTRISSDGRVMEWLEEYEEAEPGHRHVSQLYGLYPSEQITVDGTPKLAEAAKKTLKERLSHGGGHTGWSRAWIMNHYAKLWDGESAHDNIQKMLVQSTYPNLFDKHPPFQIDGNFGATAAIAQMLVQSNEDRVVLLPALPKAWKSGSVSGLKLVGNAEVSLAWADGVLTECEITCLGESYNTMVKYDEKCHMIALTNGEKWSF